LYLCLIRDKKTLMFRNGTLGFYYLCHTFACMGGKLEGGGEGREMTGRKGGRKGGEGGRIGGRWVVIERKGREGVLPEEVQQSWSFLEPLNHWLSCPRQY
jgi:hypothetical protein